MSSRQIPRSCRGSVGIFWAIAGHADGPRRRTGRPTRRPGQAKNGPRVYFSSRDFMEPYLSTYRSTGTSTGLLWLVDRSIKICFFLAPRDCELMGCFG